MQLTIVCAYCGSEDVRMPFEELGEKAETLTIQCKCGKWLCKDGIMGHKANIGSDTKCNT